jgi:hypothetical protein
VSDTSTSMGGSPCWGCGLGVSIRPTRRHTAHVWRPTSRSSVLLPAFKDFPGPPGGPWARPNCQNGLSKEQPVQGPCVGFHAGTGLTRARKAHRMPYSTSLEPGQQMAVSSMPGLWLLRVISHTKHQRRKHACGFRSTPQRPWC